MSREEPHCITCGDVAVGLTVLTVAADGTLALCEDDTGVRETVDVTLLAPVRAAERLLVHAGTAIAREGGML